MHRRYRYHAPHGGRHHGDGTHGGSPAERHIGPDDEGGREREFGSRPEGGAWGYDRGDLPAVDPDYSHRYSTAPRREDRGGRSRWGQAARDAEHDPRDRPPGPGGGRGFGGGEGRHDPDRGHHGGIGGSSGGRYGADYGGGRPYRDESFNEYEPQGRLPQMGGAGNAYPRFHGGGRYTRSGYSSGFSDEPAREFGASYGEASGYGEDDPRYGGPREPHAGGGQAGARRGAGPAGTIGRRDFERSYLQGAGGDAFGGGYPGEYGGSEHAERWRTGMTQDFRGRGPKGYARSDERLREDVCERLTDDPYVDASDIDVQAEGGVVTLSGEVSDRWMKYHVEDLIDRCPGVRDIRNELGVRSRQARDTSTSRREASSTRGNERQPPGAAGNRPGSDRG